MPTTEYAIFNGLAKHFSITFSQLCANMSLSPPAEIWLAARDELDWFTPPTANGKYQDPCQVWGNAAGGITRDSKTRARFSPQSTQVIKMLRAAYSWSGAIRKPHVKRTAMLFCAGE